MKRDRCWCAHDFGDSEDCPLHGKVGKALAELVEAAEAWEQEERPPPPAWADMTAGAALADAVDRYREVSG